MNFDLFFIGRLNPENLSLEYLALHITFDVIVRRHSVTRWMLKQKAVLS
jgi:hypothetical protein